MLLDPVPLAFGYPGDPIRSRSSETRVMQTIGREHVSATSLSHENVMARLSVPVNLCGVRLIPGRLFRWSGRVSMSFHSMSCSALGHQLT